MTLAERLNLPPLPHGVVDQLAARQYRGNVRELKHAIEAYGALGELPEGPSEEAGSLEAALEELLDETHPYAEQKERVVEVMTRIYLRKLIVRTAGNRSEAARIAELQRGYLRRLLEKYDLA
jgi:DNA-binding NtrC family response regulator